MGHGAWGMGHGALGIGGEQGYAEKLLSYPCLMPHPSVYLISPWLYNKMLKLKMIGVKLALTG